MSDQPHSELLNAELKSSLEENLSIIRTILNVPLNEDVVMRRYQSSGFELCAVYMDGMADDKRIAEFILHACKEPQSNVRIPPESRIRALTEDYIEIAQCRAENRMSELITAVLSGMTAVVVDGAAEALLLETRGYVHRTVDKPSNETVVMGSQEGSV